MSRVSRVSKQAGVGLPRLSAAQPGSGSASAIPSSERIHEGLLSNLRIPSVRPTNGSNSSDRSGAQAEYLPSTPCGGRAASEAPRLSMGLTWQDTTWQDTTLVRSDAMEDDEIPPPPTWRSRILARCRRRRPPLSHSSGATLQRPDGQRERQGTPVVGRSGRQSTVVERQSERQGPLLMGRSEKSRERESTVVCRTSMVSTGI